LLRVQAFLSLPSLLTVISFEWIDFERSVSSDASSPSVYRSQAAADVAPISGLADSSMPNVKL